MNIATMTLEQAQYLVKRAEIETPNILVRMHGKDANDSLFIIEDRRWYEQNLYSDSHFLLFVEGVDDHPTVHKCCKTMVEAAIQYAYAFVLDNCDSADAGTEVPYIHQRHDRYQEVLRDLAEVERDW